MIKLKLSITRALLFIYFLFFLYTPVYGDPGPLSQAPILSSAASKPNILIIIDDSGSMGWRRSGQSKTPMKQAQDAAISLLESLSKVRVGIASFSRYKFGGELDQPVIDLDVNRNTIYKSIQDLYPRGGTPLVGTLQDMGRYFVGLSGKVNPGNSEIENCISNGQFSGKLTLNPDDKRQSYRLDEVLPSGPYLLSQSSKAESPICHWCQKNFIILLTDGWGWGNASIPLRNYCPSCYHPLISVAAALNDIDLRPDIENFEGEEVKNNIITYTIGFHTSQTLLKETAEKGGGQYFEADNEADLKIAFEKISDDINANTSGSASNATFSTSLLQKGTNLYLTTFNTEYWVGDVIAGELDENGQPGPVRWKAASILDSQNNPETRSMLTWNSKKTQSFDSCNDSQAGKNLSDISVGGTPFRWNKLSSDHQNDLLNINITSNYFIFERQWGNFGQGSGSFGLPFDVATDTKGNVFVVDYENHLVQKFDVDGNFLKQWGGLNSGTTGLNFPVGIATDKNDNVYVAQHGSHSIKKFTGDGNYLATYGGYGLDQNQLYYPFDVAVDLAGNLYIVELQNHRIKVFDKHGEYLREWGAKGSADGLFNNPNRIAIDSGGNVFVSDYVNHRIQKFDTNGNFISKWGGYGTMDGQLRYPYGIATDDSGNVFVSEYFNRVQQFDSNGNFIEKWGSAGAGQGQFRYPRGIGVFDGGPCKGSSFFVADAYNFRVQKYASQGSKNISSDVGKARLRYLRGERSNEGKGWGFRERQSLLGDIVHSSAVYIGPPSLNWPSGGLFPGGIRSYSRFAQDNRNRMSMVAVGSNDGMLHLFSADTGKELLAYLPNNLFSVEKNAGYHYLTDSKYSHRYYVDGTPTVSDVFISSSSSEPEWQTVLVGIEGSGGRGIFALNLTDPNKFSEDYAKELVLWEFSSRDDPHFGYTLSRPTIALLPNGRWAVITGNGYQHIASDTPTAGQAELFVIYIDGGIDGEWTEGVDYLRLPTGVGSVDRRNGLSTPAIIDTNGDGVADLVYAGDILGNLWNFDLSSNNDSDWTISHEGPIFTSQNNQPITVKPEVIKHPIISTSGNEPNMLIFFGTGQYLVSGDNSTVDQQSFYAVWDKGDHELLRSNLVGQEFLISAIKDGRITNPNRWQDLSVDYKGASKGDRYGWYIDLPDIGERVVTDARYRNGIVFFNTLVPTDPKPCASGGTGWMMSVDAITGGSPGLPAFDFNGDGQINIDGDAEVQLSNDGKSQRIVSFSGKKYSSKSGIPSGISIIGDNRYTSGSGTDDSSEISVEAISDGKDQIDGRVSWDQLSPTTPE